jgi:hypothetical protein
VTATTHSHHEPPTLAAPASPLPATIYESTGVGPDHRGRLRFLLVAVDDNLDVGATLERIAELLDHLGDAAASNGDTGGSPAAVDQTPDRRTATPDPVDEGPASDRRDDPIPLSTRVSRPARGPRHRNSPPGRVGPD